MTTESNLSKGVFLGSMLNNEPSSNGAGSSPSITEVINPETGEIYQFIDEQNKPLKEQPKSPAELRLDKWALHTAVQRLLRHKRVNACCRLRATSAADVIVFRNSSLKSAHYGNLQTCASVWDDPVCAAKISEKRRCEVRKSMDRWEAESGQVLLLSLTHAHSLSDVLKDLLKGEQAAMASMVRDRGFRELMAEMGCIGRIRAWEVTHGVNGFHPHFHILFFACPNLDITALEDRFYDLWLKACFKAGLPLPDRQHGVDLQDGSEAHGYVSKGGWGMEHEITKGHLKKSYKGRSPMELVSSWLYDDDKQAGALFIEYSKAFHGMRQLVWSNGLKKRLGIEDKTDQDLANEQDQDAEIFCRIEFDDWKRIIKYQMRGEVLELARIGSKDGIDRLLENLKNIEVMK